MYTYQVTETQCIDYLKYFWNDLVSSKETFQCSDRMFPSYYGNKIFCTVGYLLLLNYTFRL